MECVAVGFLSFRMVGLYYSTRSGGATGESPDVEFMDECIQIANYSISDAFVT